MSTFVLMGVLSSLFGAVAGPLLVRLEKPVGVLIGVVGLLVSYSLGFALPMLVAGYAW